MKKKTIFDRINWDADFRRFSQTPNELNTEDHRRTPKNQCRVMSVPNKCRVPGKTKEKFDTEPTEKTLKRFIRCPLGVIQCLIHGSGFSVKFHFFYLRFSAFSFSFRAIRVLCVSVTLWCIFFSQLFAKLLIPMDLTQTDHLMAYGVAYSALQQNITVEWLLNYRGGSFLLSEQPSLKKLCQIRGVRFELVNSSQEVTLRKVIEQENMDAILLEKAPKIAVYIPPNALPWDDAVQLALDYAKIPYDKLWDKEVVSGKLSQYDWLHMHHEDFTGQFGKFGANYYHTEWYQQDVAINNLMAKSLTFNKVSKLKLSVIKEIKRYIDSGGMVFAMCSSTDTPDIAFAAEGTDIVPAEFDGDPVDLNYLRKLDYSNCLAFENFSPVIDPNVYEHSDIDTYIEASARGPNVYFALFDFSAKYDPVPTMLVQNHVGLVREFLGQNCGFRREKIKKNVLILGDVSNTEQVKYIHGKYGKGTFTFLGGHDPEDFAHRIGDPPTNLELHKNSPGYRLILNNVLFPAAEKKPLKT